MTLKASEDGCPNLKYRTIIRKSIELKDKIMTRGLIDLESRNMIIEKATPRQAGMMMNGSRAKAIV
jgi:hypothetical protein